MEKWQDPVTRTKAGLLFAGLLKSEVLIGIFVPLKLSCLLLPPCRPLQEKGADLMSATQLRSGVVEEMELSTRQYRVRESFQ